MCCRPNTRARIIHVKWVGSGECTCGRPRTLVSLTAALTPTLVLRAGALSTLLTSRGTRALGLIEKRQVAPEIRTPRVLGDGLIGIDFDRCIDENGELHQAVVRSIIALGSYAGFSPSGRGVHILVHGAIGRSRRFAESPTLPAREIYDGGRYFTMTGRRVPFAPETIATSADAQAALDRVLSEMFSDESP